ncbi:MAG: 3-oxo-tetronate kinase [Desulfobacterales bacterium]
MSVLLGAIGDDMTGSTDLALMLGKNGMTAVQYIGVPGPQDTLPTEATAAVVSLKSRTVSATEAVDRSVAACDWLVRQGARQIFFKYCSTFDSTERGNIGPVAEALLDRLEASLTIVCPAFPANERTVYQGHLFVGALPLSESGMRNHPLTPMTDANLVRFLGKQVRTPGSVDMIPLQIIEKGPPAIEQALDRLARRGRRFAVMDAVNDRNLIDIGTACSKLKLITGGSGVAMGLPANFRRAGALNADGGMARLPKLKGAAVVLAGSCSQATRRQINRMTKNYPGFQLDPLALSEGRQTVETAVFWAKERMDRHPVLIYSSASPEIVSQIQFRLGKSRSGELVESTLAEVARRLLTSGMTKLIVAGGETSGAVVQALELKSLRIGPEIEPGVPWTFTLQPTGLCLALKSGNFGGESFFEKALAMLP